MNITKQHLAEEYCVNDPAYDTMELLEWFIDTPVMDRDTKARLLEQFVNTDNLYNQMVDDKIIIE